MTECKPRIADLFCGAGGAGMGLHRAGFEVVGFDIAPQPHYPFAFVQADALTVDLRGFDAVWASPPCQRYSVLVLPKNKKNKTNYPDLVAPTRTRLEASGLPFIIENVVGAPLIRMVMLCGQMFGLKVFRHRWFESNILFLAPPHERHNGFVLAALGNYQTLDKAPYITVVAHRFRTSDGRKAMGIEWMNRDELAEAVPPAYAEFLGRQLIRYCKRD
jgi:DNA (cytosine-5)-methyltransferase 1